MTKVFAANYIAFLMLGSAFVGVMTIRHGDFLVMPTMADLFWTLVAAPILFAAVMAFLRVRTMGPRSREEYALLFGLLLTLLALAILAIGPATMRAARVIFG